MTTPKLHAERSARLLWPGLVIADTAAQLLFKSAAVRLAPPDPTFTWVAMVAQSWRVWSAVGCIVITFGFWMLILRRAQLSRAFPVTALTFIGVITGSWWFFGETIAPIQYIGIALIVGGVALLKPLSP